MLIGRKARLSLLDICDLKKCKFFCSMYKYIIFLCFLLLGGEIEGQLTNKNEYAFPKHNAKTNIDTT